MKLTSESVSKVFFDCLFKDGEATEPRVEVEGVVSRFGFHPQRLESHASEIEELLNQLPETFHSEKGGGWSFLNACMTKEGEQWGEHSSIEQLLALGVAIGKAKILLPRAMWQMLPGGVPYFQTFPKPVPESVA